MKMISTLLNSAIAVRKHCLQFPGGVSDRGFLCVLIKIYWLALYMLLYVLLVKTLHSTRHGFYQGYVVGILKAQNGEEGSSVFPQFNSVACGRKVFIRVDG